MNHNERLEPPEEIRAPLPPVDRLIAGLSTELTIVESGDALYRATFSPDGILPDRVSRPYRLGPPDTIITADGAMPFWWLYAALVPDVTVWEARFCLNDDMARPGTFYIAPAAINVGLSSSVAVVESERRCVQQARHLRHAVEPRLRVVSVV